MATATAVSGSEAGRFLPAAARLSSVDVLRGLVMVIMALDHTRDFFSSATFDPTDLSRTTPLLFFTRWITHFCAPVFVLLAGSGAYLSLTRGKDRRALSRFLVTRGLWLVFLEVFVISPLGWSFSLSFGFTRLQVIWVIGLSMMVIGGLILLWPARVIGSVGIAMILIHNAFDGANPTTTWRILHQISFFQPWPHKIVASLYPIVPWLGVMMAGYALGEVLTMDAARRRVLFWLGISLTVLFIVLRASNVYGDPYPWSRQANLVSTAMSFLRCNKYPPSLLYLLMTLGPSLIVLACLDGAHGWLWQRLRDFGRVPLFYYLLHLPLLHGLAILFALAKYGSASWLYQDLMGIRGSANALPAGYGYGLPVVYAVWLSTVVALYPLCRWFAGVKKNRREAIYSYL